MPGQSRRDRDRSSGDSSVDSSSSTSTESSESTSTDSSRPWYADMWSHWFAPETASDVSVDAPEAEVSPSSAEVEEVIEAASADSGNSELEGEMLEAAAAELTEDQAYKLEEDMHVTAQEGGEKVELAPGSHYTVTADDVPSHGDMWKGIARNHGTTPEKLAAFNDGVEIAEGVQIYIPSPEERLFAEYRKKYSFDEAVTEYGKAKEGPSVSVYSAASDRASGKVGESYGTKGVEGGKFMTSNPEIAGASKRRSEQVNGQTEYKVFWIKDFWKCSIFMNDAVFQGGYKPALMGNKHYSVAGRAHQQTQVYEEVSVDKARPGDAWQRFGGTKSDQSHNAILSSFVDVEKGESGDTWTFKIIGAESERAAEAEKTKNMQKGSNKTSDGKIIRFLRPKTKRE